MNWPWRKHREDDLDRELRSDLELETAEQQDRGLTPGQARLAAQRAFGNTTHIRELTREAWGWVSLERFARDARYAIRVLLRNPGFTLVAVLSLGLGIGANTAIFTFVNAALLKPMPYPQPDRIVALQEIQPKNRTLTLVHPRSFVEWRNRSRSFEALAILQAIPFNTDGPDGPEQVPGAWATPEIFRVFATDPLIGRVFTPAEALPGANPVFILSHRYWQSRFASDPNIVGKAIRMQRQTGIVVGVMPPGFKIGTLNTDVYWPLPLDLNRPETVGSRAFQCYGRLRPGVTLNAVRAEMSVIASQAGRDYKIDEGWGIAVVTLRDYLVQGSRQILLLLFGVVALVLLIAGANVASLMLTRGIGRSSELALRASLGASRSRLTQQLLVESLVLSLTGGAVGLVLGAWASKTLLLLAKQSVAFGQMTDVGLDGRVLLFTTLLSALTGVVFGVVPALQLSRFDLLTALNERDRGSGGRRRQRFRSALVVGEVALAVVLLVGAGLLLRTFSQMLAVKLGFHPEHVLTMRTFVTGDPIRRAALIEGMRDRVETLPGVSAVGAIQFLPLDGMTNRGPFHVVGSPADDPAAKPEADTAVVSRGYFSAMGIPILRGRAFGLQDRADSTRVVLVNQAFVNRYFPHQDPIGHSAVGDWASPSPAEIVGVVGDIRHDALTAEPRPTFYLSQSQSPGYLTYLVVRTCAQPETLVPAIRRELRRLDPLQPLTDIRPMEQYVAGGLARPRLYAALVSSFSSLALALAAIGLYGLMSYSVKQRTQEIGIRMALGARPRTVLGAIIGQGLRLTALGLALGVACALALSRFVETFLYGVRPMDLRTYLAVVAVLGGAALLAAYIPARRASRVDPMIALKYE